MRTFDKEKDRCGNCFFGDIDRRHNHSVFVCRFNAPKIIHGVGTGKTDEKFPIMDQHRDWCSHWKPDGEK